MVKKLSERIKFINSDDLIKLILLKEQNKNSELDENFEENEYFKKIDKKENEEESDKELINSKQVRKLKWEGSFSSSWTLARSNILGQTVSLQYEISLSNGELSNTLSVSCGYVTFYYGNTGNKR